MMRRLYIIFALSGAASLIYEVVWFQLLRLTIGVNSGSLGITLACFMGGLFVGSFGYARWAPVRWNPLRTYALMEAAIGVIGLFLPALRGGIRDSYLAQAHDPRIAFVLRSIISAGLLMPPTILMGATLPALSRWVKADDRQVSSIGRLYASNIIGAVFGALGAAFLLMPHLEFLKTNLTAVVLNGCIAVLSLTIRDRYQAPGSDARSTSTGEASDSTPVYLAYARAAGVGREPTDRAILQAPDNSPCAGVLFLRNQSTGPKGDASTRSSHIVRMAAPPPLHETIQTIADHRCSDQSRDVEQWPETPSTTILQGPDEAQFS